MGEEWEDVKLIRREELETAKMSLIECEVAYLKRRHGDRVYFYVLEKILNGDSPNHWQQVHVCLQKENENAIHKL